MGDRIVYCLLPSGTSTDALAQVRAQFADLVGVEVLVERRVGDRRAPRRAPRSREEERRSGADRRRPIVPRHVDPRGGLPPGTGFVQRLVPSEPASELLELDAVIAALRAGRAAAAPELYWRTYERLHSRLVVVLGDDELAHGLVPAAFGGVLDVIEDGDLADEGFEDLLYLAVDVVAEEHLPPAPETTGEAEIAAEGLSLALEGVDDDRVTVVERDSRWFARALAERHRLLRRCRDDFVAVEHIGSTAVPAIAGRSIVDILVGVASLPVPAGLLETLLDHGFEPLGEAGTPGRAYFRRRGPLQDVDLHVVEHGGRLWQDALSFREYLRRHPAEARRWSNAKKDAARGGAVPYALYTEARAAVLAEILERHAASLGTSVPG